MIPAQNLIANPTAMALNADRGARHRVTALTGADARAFEALFEACLLGSVGFAAALLTMGASVNAVNENGDTPLIHAAVQGNACLVEFLVEAGAEINARNDHGITALMEAAFWGNLEAVEVLVKHGAEILCQDRAGRNALQWAIIAGREEVINFLFAKRGHLRARFLDRDGSRGPVHSSSSLESAGREGTRRFELL